MQKFQKPDRRFKTNEKLVQPGDHPKTQKFQKKTPKPKFQKPKNQKIPKTWQMLQDKRKKWGHATDQS